MYGPDRYEPGTKKQSIGDESVLMTLSLFTVARGVTVGSGESLSEEEKREYRRLPPNGRKINMVFWEKRCHSRHILQKIKQKGKRKQIFGERKRSAKKKLYAHPQQ